MKQNKTKQKKQNKTKKNQNDYYKNVKTKTTFSFYINV